MIIFQPKISIGERADQLISFANLKFNCRRPSWDNQTTKKSENWRRKKLAPVGNRKWKSNNDFGFKRKEIDCGTQLWAELSKFIALLELPLRRSSAPTGVIRFSPYFSPKVELLQSYTAGSDVGHAGFKGFQRSVLPKLFDSWEPWIMTITGT